MYYAFIKVSRTVLGTSPKIQLCCLRMYLLSLDLLSYFEKGSFRYSIIKQVLQISYANI